MYDKQANSLPMYRSIRLVHAAQINDVVCPVGATHASLSVKGDYGIQFVTADLKGKPAPTPGWWVIFYDDGYVSFCPPESFARGYVRDGTYLMDDAAIPGHRADTMIAAEIGRQDKMWGLSNDRADSSRGQLMHAGMAQVLALALRQEGDANAFAQAPVIYPADWSGFRDYGSDVANLVVAVAFLRQEIKRKIALGEDTTRTSRDPQAQPYTGDQPTAYTS